jgi:hypothetical protein
MHLARARRVSLRELDWSANTPIGNYKNLSFADGLWNVGMKSAATSFLLYASISTLRCHQGELSSIIGRS